jgi:hypothetical protein
VVGFEFQDDAVADAEGVGLFVLVGLEAQPAARSLSGSDLTHAGPQTGANTNTSIVPDPRPAGVTQCPGEEQFAAVEAELPCPILIGGGCG